jgi:RNA polymerase sigma factor for flagellar operon FliA
MVTDYLGLVRSAVNRIKTRLPAHTDADDLHSAGVLGLIAAVRKFKPESARTFAGFAHQRITGAILDELRRMDTCSRRSRAFVRQLAATSTELEQRLQRAATEEELRAALGWSTEEYRRRSAMAHSGRLVSLDREIENGEESTSSLHNILRDPDTESGFDRMQRTEQIEIVAQLIAEQPEVPRKVLSLHYYEGMQFNEIAEVFDLSIARICQIHRKAVKQLRLRLQRSLES